ncbi:putative S-locus lectin protein kinase family protein [Quillaja saponaria]|uniref:S-locus lectin protein kinase family protein n=1 Tax=Quillaja saponaria TaxID=32244 RepID=A0AAD7VP07_QUISA|nr:putative S-locus lectin protein kinase family protein [Quillaja saponaria]
MNNLIDSKHWLKLCAPPLARVIALAREFYANLVDKQDIKIMVRGKMISFISMAINAYYGIPDIPETDKYMTYASKIVDYDTVIGALCYQGMSIDIGRIIHSVMLQAANSGHLGIWFPSLITELCHEASVFWENTDPLVLQKSIIDDKLMRKFQIQNAKVGEAYWQHIHVVNHQNNQLLRMMLQQGWDPSTFLPCPKPLAIFPRPEEGIDIDFDDGRESSLSFVLF